VPRYSVLDDYETPRSFQYQPEVSSLRNMLAGKAVGPADEPA